jgi:hypothetical protein
MQIREHRRIKAKHRRQPYYFKRWFCCRKQHCYLQWTAEAGVMLKVTKAEVEHCGGLKTFMPMDLTEEERFRYAEQETKYFFWGRGTRKCETCGHIARGKLAQSTAAEKERWKREQEEAEEDFGD